MLPDDSVTEDELIAMAYSQHPCVDPGRSRMGFGATLPEAPNIPRRRTP